ncbi:hypothetical protein HN784_03175 [bacterium]|jgi:hypothetical protein|nr:hypothetical protein [bacterium]MBT4598323.1 hypothetical protein [bacterium]MBT6754156.1 hypothetical protein [bacterium]MBT7037976.1 hypothetical protein [bacterium]MBT7431816.1 hypothetical protein [bacterium]
MEIKELLVESRRIWRKERCNLSGVIVRMGVVFGDICRWERDEKKDRETHNDEELQKELGNLIFSTIRWCDDLGYDPNECIKKALKAQNDFVEINRTDKKCK